MKLKIIQNTDLAQLELDVNSAVDTLEADSKSVVAMQFRDSGTTTYCVIIYTS